MACYWARFERKGSEYFRYDTRVYLEDVDTVERQDACIGAVVGKNPGSARPTNPSGSVIQPIDLANYKLLPNIQSIVSKAYSHRQIQMPSRAYVQILNLFYLCDADLSSGLDKLKHLAGNFCDTESREFPWVWYVWGDNDPRLSELKLRFHNLRSRRHLFYDPSQSQIRTHCPRPEEFARHTQGLRHDLVVPALASCIEGR